ncbi:hypothetical protein BX616_007316 [Lobosporangium transversale]|uniref:Kelch repeat protein n=1 Tax=Lobosporangium transversale TaxID=64571 RepID=A0A1Y2H3G4_9FUNG|nr:hypothetical protein BCR41DRAFT_344539 [Lobosporangium transversale]KAF9914915.1 hypothetical protein BX616_007316 [Lobosporangium transversale]ORZ29099.1 hypothetical protein BCR41DRAFT_344539 [Lobosporangium transversale]|eukprot:XP_021886772.1 hypothetical protein BCR41DRAFT_344539 [Lobosporangium transversale]
MHYSRLCLLSFVVALATQASNKKATADAAPDSNVERPIPAIFMQYAYSENQKLFVSAGDARGRGGSGDDGRGPVSINPSAAPAAPGTVVDDQFLSLDLSVPWTSDTAPWKRLEKRLLPPGMITVGARTNLVVTPDNASVLFLDIAPGRYDIKTDKWSLIKPDSVFSWDGVFTRSATLDTDAGVVYGIGVPILPENVTDITKVPKPTSWYFAELELKTMTFKYKEQEGRPSFDHYVSTVYSSAKKALFMYEWNTPAGETPLLTYDTVKQTWSEVKTTGDVPSNRDSTCLVSAYGGKKLILVGGDATGNSSNTLSVLKDVYMLDTTTLIWKRLPDASRAYAGAVCAVSGDFLIIHGGYNENGSNNEDGPAVFNMVTNYWGSQYTPNTSTEPKDFGSGSDPSGAGHTRQWMNLSGSAILVMIASSLLW